MHEYETDQNFSFMTENGEEDGYGNRIHENNAGAKNL